MKRRVRIPAVLAVTYVALAAGAGCRSGTHKSDAGTEAGGCELYCIGSGASCGQCADAGSCPSGCQPIG